MNFRIYNSKYNSFWSEAKAEGSQQSIRLAILDAIETVWNFQKNISGHAKAHLQISRLIWQVFLENPKFFSQNFEKSTAF